MKKRICAMLLGLGLICGFSSLAQAKTPEVQLPTLAEQATTGNFVAESPILAAVEEKDYNKALALANTAIEKSPEEATAYSYRAMVYSLLRQYDAALADANQAVSLEPEVALHYINRGEIYHACKEYRAALDDYTKALDLPGAPKVLIYMNRARTYADQGQYQEAMADIKAGRELDDSFYPLYLMESYVQDKEGHHLAAQKALQQYVMYHLTREKKYYLAGIAAEKAGLTSQALTLLNAAVKEEPHNAAIYSLRGLIYAETGNYEAGINDFTQAIHLRPLAMDYNNRGECYRHLKKYDLAKQDYEEALNLAQETEDLHAIYDSLGQWSLEMEDYPAAEDYFTAALTSGAYEEGYKLRARAREKQGENEAADEDTRTALEMEQKKLLQE